METKEQYMVTPVMDFEQTVKTVDEMKKNAEANVAFANQLKANIVALQKSTAHDLVVHNGKVLVKVERKAREGDFVVFEGLESNYTINGKFYETYEKDGALCYKATDNLSYTVYGWGDFCEITKVYEVIGNLPQSNLVVEAFEPIPIENGTKPPCKHLTANQKRARVIAMAKEFVEDQNCNVEFIRKGNRVTCLLKELDTNKVRFVGRAECHVDDVFNEHIGQAVALAKALDIVEQLPPDILKAVQPTLAVGQVVKRFTHHNQCLGDEVVEKSVKFYKQENAFLINNSLVFEVGVDKIIDDTNAQYETIKGGE